MRALSPKCSSAARLKRKMPPTLILTASTMAAVGAFKMPPATATPGPCTTIFTGPVMADLIASMALSWLISACTTLTSLNCSVKLASESALRPTASTCRPLSISCRTISTPKVPVAPTTMARFLSGIMHLFKQLLLTDLSLWPAS